MKVCNDDRSAPPEAAPATGADINPAEILARYWNDRVPALENIETISWWLRQASDADAAC